MRKDIYGRDYFTGIYNHLKKEKSLVLESFLELLLKKKSPVDKLLDLGCGQGEFLEVCAPRGIEAYGVDVSRYAFKKTRDQFRGKIFLVDLEKDRLPFANNEFVAVTAFDLVEHLHCFSGLFQEAYRVLKHRGIFFLTTPNAEYRLADFFGRRYGGDPTHVNIRSAATWVAQLKKAGFTDIEVKGSGAFGFPPTLNLRHRFRQWRLPVVTRPFFCPLLELAFELFIFVRKK